MSLAKALSSAYLPVSAAVIPGHMYEAMVESVSEVGVFGHGYTYSGHPVACAVASKVLDIYQRDHIFEHAASTGALPAGAPCVRRAITRWWARCEAWA
jgi:4-aminobutyrate--pyruvate transaminase